MTHPEFNPSVTEFVFSAGKSNRVVNLTTFLLTPKLITLEEAVTSRIPYVFIA
jgi:hypothetical protein